MELLAVIAIMALMLGMFLLSTNVIGRRAARQCAKQLKHELDQTRISTMGKNRVFLYLHKSADNKIMVQQITRISDINNVAATHYVNGEEREAGSARVKLEFLSSVGGTMEELNTDGIYFEFNRSTGAFKTVKSSEITAEITGANAGQITAASGYTIKEIQVTGGGLTEKLTLHPITGKVTEN